MYQGGFSSFLSYRDLKWVDLKTILIRVFFLSLIYSPINKSLFKFISAHFSNQIHKHAISFINN